MVTFFEAVASGIVGAAFLGFAYWGILVLIQPGLDRLRVIIHGQSVAAVPATPLDIFVAEMQAKSVAAIFDLPTATPPSDPMTPLSIISPRRVPNNYYELGIKAGLIKAVMVAAGDVVFLDSRKVRAGETWSDKIEGCTPNGIVFLQSGGVRPCQREVILHEHISLNPSMGVVAFRKAFSPPLPEIADLLRAPEDASMSKLRMSKFSRPPAVC